MDERAHAGKSWDEVVRIRDLENAFEGDYKCSLCPKKILKLEKDLNEHLQSKGHKIALTRYYKKNKV